MACIGVRGVVIEPTTGSAVGYLGDISNDATVLVDRNGQYWGDVSVRGNAEGGLWYDPVELVSGALGGKLLAKGALGGGLGTVESRAAERIAGYELWGTKKVLGTVYERRITHIMDLQHVTGGVLGEAVKSEGLPALLRAFRVEASAAGASTVRIVGLEVENPALWTLLNKLAQRGHAFGYRIRWLDEKTIEMVTTVR